MFPFLRGILIFRAVSTPPPKVAVRLESPRLSPGKS